MFDGQHESARVLGSGPAVRSREVCMVLSGDNPFPVMDATERHFETLMEISDLLLKALVLMLRWPWWPPIVRQWGGGHSFEEFTELGNQRFSVLCICGCVAEFSCVGYLGSSLFRYGFISTPWLMWALLWGIVFAALTAVRVIVYALYEFEF
jgi:hypothetical protein